MARKIQAVIQVHPQGPGWVAHVDLPALQVASVSGARTPRVACAKALSGVLDQADDPRLNMLHGLLCGDTPSQVVGDAYSDFPEVGIPFFKKLFGGVKRAAQGIISPFMPGKKGGGGGTSPVPMPGYVPQDAFPAAPAATTVLPGTTIVRF